jgi:hypothetical protein
MTKKYSALIHKVYRMMVFHHGNNGYEYGGFDSQPSG